MKPVRFIITGTDTGIGKTLVSAIISRHYAEQDLNVSYYKPMASGCTSDGKCADADFVKAYTGDLKDFHTTYSYNFKQAAAPLFAALLEKVKIEKSCLEEDFSQAAQGADVLIIEGCGGVLVPILPDGTLQADLWKDWGLPIIVVARTALGTINHTLLTIEALKYRSLKIVGLIFSGYQGTAEEDHAIHTIEKLSQVTVLGILPFYKDLDTEHTPPTLKSEKSGAFISWHILDEVLS